MEHHPAVLRNSPPPPPPPEPLPGGCQISCANCDEVHTVSRSVSEFVCFGCGLVQAIGRADEVSSGDVELTHPLPPEESDEGTFHDVKFSKHSSQQEDVTCPPPPREVKEGFSGAPKLSNPPPPTEDVNEVAIEVEREEDSGGVAGETFTDYRPPKLSVGPPHPDPIVETSSLSAVQPPEPTYDLRIRGDLERTEALSCLQIETLVYASQKHLQRLPDSTRAGFFLGDGAGVGKGRTIAGLILENWQYGRKKALWISVGSDLKFDARRDLDDVGAKFIEVHALNKLPYSKLDSKAVGVKEGVIFLTYSSLIASSEQGRSRLKQLVQWCGKDYDGLIVFDECHKAKNLVPEAGQRPTRTGETVLEIQALLPEARVVYCSATGASEPRNMGYMIRLGLWGTGTSFLDFPDFIGSLEKGGVGALELVAMDLKARGMYLCRTLSYKGAEFDVVEVPLEDKMMVMYNRAAEFWVYLKEKLESEIALLTTKMPKNSQLWLLYWGNHQRFFKHMCMSAKVPAVVKICHQALAEDKCVVIGLQSTGEARTEDAVAKSVNGIELDDFISGPRELLLKFIEESYPLPEKPASSSGEDGVKELQRKRRSVTTGVSYTERTRKAAKLQDESDTESETDSESESMESDDEFQISEISDSEPESTESDDGFHESMESNNGFHICEICNSDTESDKLLQCSRCKQVMHPACLVPPVTGSVSADWSCLLCEGKAEEYLRQKRKSIAQQLERYSKAAERKSQILDAVRSLDLPLNPLDDILDQLGGPDKVAEITGRRHRLIRERDGNGVRYQPRNSKDVSMEMVNINEKQLFMDGKKLVAIISEAGSAGVSLQADKRAINQRRRVHLTIELPWSADRAIQQFGRTHRSNQASAPEYRLLFSKLGGERRFASIIAKRLESLGALTQGDRRAGPSLRAYNYDSPYGKRALAEFYDRIVNQSSLLDIPPGFSIEKPNTIEEFIIKGKAALASVGLVKDNSYVDDKDIHNVARFLNRLLGLQPEMQNLLFEFFVSILDLFVQNARLEGQFDSGIADLKANTIKLKGLPKNVHVDHLSGASTVLYTFTLDRGFTWEAASTLLDEKKKDMIGSSRIGFYESRREWQGRRHYLLAFQGSSGMFRIVRPATGEAVREMPLLELEEKYSKLKSLKKARTCWENEFRVSSKQCMHGPNCKLGDYCTTGRRLQEVNVLSGLILPVWATIEKTLANQVRKSHRRLRIVRVETTTDHQRIVGLLIPNAVVNSMLKDLVRGQDINDSLALEDK
ncbi:protein FORGETTER 1 [Daucus carota subsp. sativus]|uniref:protein FORGETTER 1 n=1 Tax=Daucus carota subsp. sativus TaxID=79200 RepID=UPI0007EF6A77|nr:PREDICTED: protein strawberry notch homolog 1-like [Daucus carota subsp. sativus]